MRTRGTVTVSRIEFLEKVQTAPLLVVVVQSSRHVCVSCIVLPRGGLSHACREGNSYFIGREVEQGARVDQRSRKHALSHFMHCIF